MIRPLSLVTIFDRLQDTLILEPVVLEREHAPKLPTEPLSGGAPTLVGHLNLIKANHIQILGATELDFWEGSGPAARHDLLRDLFNEKLCGLVITDGRDVPEDILDTAQRHHVPLLKSALHCEHVVSTLRYELGRELTASIVLHGVFLNVLGVGVLLSGASAVGKSELALELISRGHSLVADDAPEFSRPTPDTIEGIAPLMIKDFLEVRGLGVLNIRAMYGDSAIRHRKRLELIIHLEPLTSALREQLDRLEGNFSSTDILGLSIATMTLPVAPGRNLGVMVEAGVRTFLLTGRGYKAAADLEQRQQDIMERNSQ